MATILAKIKRNNSWISIQDQVSLPDWENIAIDGAMPFDPNNNCKELWFYIEKFNTHDSFLPILDQDVDTADLNHLDRDDFCDIDFIALSYDNKYFLQKVNKGSFICRNAIFFGDAAELKKLTNTIYINSIPNSIYDKTTKRLYFMDMSKATALFSQLKLDYKEATNNDVQSFFKAKIVDHTGLDINQVSILNRKKISAVLTEYDRLSDDNKQKVKEYVKEMTKEHIRFDEDTQLFKTPDDKALRAVLYGLQQRFYLPPLEKEPQVATSSTKVSSLFT